MSSEPLFNSVTVFCLSWKWRKRSSVKIAERTYEEGTKALHCRRESSHLEATPFGQGEEGWVNLSDFWDRHTRFVGVMQLWESRLDEEALRQAWRWIYERLDQINRVPPAAFGAMPNWNFDKYYKFPGVFPWERGGIGEGLQNPHSFLLKTTHEVVHYELNLHTQECRQIWTMQPVGRSQDVRFEPIRSYGSLWAAIWDLFGQDISALTHAWRVCLECGRRFYPKDHRSVCCTTRHQALWSKRKWAREHRRPQILCMPKS
jgi:hypothetical protein